jgi:hypothetical protein
MVKKKPKKRRDGLYLYVQEPYSIGMKTTTRAKQFDSTMQLRAANDVLSARIGVATAQSQHDLSDARQLAAEVARGLS